jgi:heme oxygenase
MSQTAIDSSCVMDRLRSETRPHHDRAEQSGFGTLVMDGGLTMPHYVAHLAAWRRILAHLEQALRCSDDEVVQAVWNEGLAKAPILDRDLDALSPGGVVWRDSTGAAVAAFTDLIDRLADEEPRSLLGVLYVLEGSTMGGSVMKPRIAGQLDLDGDHGLTYYGVYGKNVGPNFKIFRASMADAANGTGAEDRIVDAAKATFDGVSDILRTIAAPE